MEILWPRVVGIGVAVGSDDETAIIGQRLIKRANRTRATYEQRDDIARKNDDVFEGQKRMAVMESKFRFHGGHTGVPRI
jgi:hypothetical protein